jgi:hypothetical protein
MWILSQASQIMVWRIILMFLLLNSTQKNTRTFQFPECDTKSKSLYPKHCSVKNTFLKRK